MKDWEKPSLVILSVSSTAGGYFLGNNEYFILIPPYSEYLFTHPSWKGTYEHWGEH